MIIRAVRKAGDDRTRRMIGQDREESDRSLFLMRPALGKSRLILRFARGAYAPAGNAMENSVPLPSSLWNQMRPPSFSTMDLHM